MHSLSCYHQTFKHQICREGAQLQHVIPIPFKHQICRERGPTICHVHPIPFKHQICLEGAHILSCSPHTFQTSDLSRGGPHTACSEQSTVARQLGSLRRIWSQRAGRSKCLWVSTPWGRWAVSWRTGGGGGCWGVPRCSWSVRWRICTAHVCTGCVCVHGLYAIRVSGVCECGMRMSRCLKCVKCVCVCVCCVRVCMCVTAFQRNGRVFRGQGRQPIADVCVCVCVCVCVASL